MRKLYLTSFEFKTGENVHHDYRLVVVDSEDVNRYKEKHKDDHMKSDDVELSVAYGKFTEWFPEMYPESELIYHIAHPAID